MRIREVEGATPNTVNPSVTRTRRYLTGREVEKLIEAARKHGRYGHRDATMILLAYRHGLRATRRHRMWPGEFGWPMKEVLMTDRANHAHLLCGSG
jgi:integrase